MTNEGNHLKWRQPQQNLATFLKAACLHMEHFDANFVGERVDEARMERMRSSTLALALRWLMAHKYFLVG